MALILKGDLSFKLQVEQSHPVPDSIYKLHRRNETWQGKISDLETFLTARPFGAVHPQFTFLKLSEIGEPQRREAGMVDVRLMYAGNPAGQINWSASGDFQTQRKSISGFKFRRIWITSGDVWATGRFEAWEISDAVKELANRVPTVNFRYAFQGRVYSPKFAAAAAIELNPAPVSGGDGVVAQIGNWRLNDGQYPEWVLAAYAQTKNRIPQNSAFQFVANPAGGTALPTPQQIQPTPISIICSGVSSNPAGDSGWFEIEETWEKSYSES